MKNPALLEDIKTYKGRDEVPEDFDAFWDEEVKKVSTLPAYQLEERDFRFSPSNLSTESSFRNEKRAFSLFLLLFSLIFLLLSSGKWFDNLL